MKLLAELLLALASLVVLPGTGQATTCSEVANVLWETDTSRLIVTGAIVAVPGCADGEVVAFQLLLDDGSELPEDGPLMGTVTDERARFDLSEARVKIEPVTGVRVFLEIQGDEQYTWQITVDRRFFNAAGNEQVGLRDLTILQVPHDGSYRVEGAPARYLETSCAELGYEQADAIAEGSGTFENVTAGGRHIVCYQQTTAGRGPANASDTDVLDGSLERDPDDRTEVLRTSHERPGPSSTAGPLGRLAMTGNDLLLAATIGLATVGIGFGLLRRRA
jgi:hypothetical protein